MAEILKLLVASDGQVEAFYRFPGPDGLPQSAAMLVVADASTLLASSLAEVEAALAALGPETATPAELVDAMTKRGQAKAAEAAARAAEAAARAAESAANARLATIEAQVEAARAELAQIEAEKVAALVAAQTAAEPTAETKE